VPEVKERKFQPGEDWESTPLFAGIESPPLGLQGSTRSFTGHVRICFLGINRKFSRAGNILAAFTFHNFLAKLNFFCRVAMHGEENSALLEAAFGALMGMGNSKQSDTKRPQPIFSIDGHYVRHLLKWFYSRTVLFNAPFDKFGLKFRFLSRQQIDFRFKAPVTRQFDLDSMFSRTDQQRMNCAT
jgi:hypothetical protein